jgi:hypothetical protein
MGRNTVRGGICYPTESLKIEGGRSPGEAGS